VSASYTVGPIVR